MLTPPTATSPFQQRPAGPPDPAGFQGPPASTRLSPRNLEIHDAFANVPATIPSRASFGRGLTSDLASGLAQPGEPLMPSRGEIELQRRQLQTQNIVSHQCESAPGVLEDQGDVTHHGGRPHSIEIVIHSQPSPPGPCDHIRRPAAVAEEGGPGGEADGPGTGHGAANSPALQIVTAICRTILALLTPALAGIGTYFAAANNSSIAANGNAISQLSPCNGTLPPTAG